MTDTPVTKISREEYDSIIAKLKRYECLSAVESEYVAGVLETHRYIHDRAADHDLRIRELEDILGVPHKGSSKSNGDESKDRDDTDKGKNGSDPNEDAAEPPTDTETETPPSSANASNEDTNQDKSPNRNEHGRRGFDDFPELPICFHHHTDLRPGCPCPLCQRGRLYRMKPARFASISGQSPFDGHRHVCDRLRCNLCRATFTASVGEEFEQDGVSGERLYTYSAASVACLQKLFGGMPWYRQESLQSMMGPRVPDASMSDLCERVANAAAPIVRHLWRLAQGAVLFLGDDTGALILEQRSIMRAERRTGKLVERTGCHVSCVTAVTDEGHRLAIFKVGIQHTGELMDKILEGRDPELPPPLFMGDCLSANTVTVCQVLYGGCNSHAVRKFKDVKESFPEEAGYALERYKKIFKNEAHCKEANLDDEQRLAYHREHSKPLFLEIEAYGDALIEEKRIEPNSAIAEAFNYVINNRVRLTAFFRITGMPLENNESERILRLAVLLRDNAPFFRTTVGGAWAETLWTLGCAALNADVPLFDYFNAIQRYEADVKQNPQLWVPWTYTKRIDFLQATNRPVQAEIEVVGDERKTQVEPTKPVVDSSEDFLQKVASFHRARDPTTQATFRQ